MSELVCVTPDPEWVQWFKVIFVVAFIASITVLLTVAATTGECSPK